MLWGCWLLALANEHQLTDEGLGVACGLAEKVLPESVFLFLVSFILSSLAADDCQLSLFFPSLSQLRSEAGMVAHQPRKAELMGSVC